MVMAMAVIITAATAAIMSTDQHFSAVRFAGAAAFGFGLVLVGLAMPRLQGYFTFARLPSGIDVALASGRDISEEELTKAIEISREALEALPADAALNEMLGRLYLRAAGQAASDSESRALALRGATASITQALRHAPARGFDWSLAALLRSEANDPWETIEPFWRNSLYLAPHEASSILIRARLAAHYWTHMSQDLQGGAARDFSEMWQIPQFRREVITIYIGAPLPLKLAIYKGLPDADQGPFLRWVKAALK